MTTHSNRLNIASYVRSVEAKNRSRDTLISYETTLDQLAVYLDGRDLLKATKPELEDWMRHLLREFAATTAGTRFRGARAFFNWAVREDLITSSPMAEMTEPEADDEPVTVLPDETIVALLKLCQARGRRDFEGMRDEALIRIFCEPGSPRVGEMARMALDGVELGRQPHVRFKGKGAKWRTIPLGLKATTALERYMRLRAEHQGAQLPYLWLGTKLKDKPLTASGIQQMIERRCVKAGVPHIHPHQLRHTSAHQWKVAGGSEEDAEYLFGWTPGSGMVRRYARSAGVERAQKAARKASIGDRL